MPKAFNSITYRLVFFFIIGALSVGIVCPYDAPRLVGASGVSAANSPYVISVRHPSGNAGSQKLTWMLPLDGKAQHRRPPAYRQCSHRNEYCKRAL
jgi:hypothetical protein